MEDFNAKKTSLTALWYSLAIIWDEVLWSKYDASNTEWTPSVNWVCGTANKSYTYDITTVWTDTFCTEWTLSWWVNPSFPAQWASVSWSCNSTNGGSASSCSALRGTNPYFVKTVAWGTGSSEWPIWSKVDGNWNTYIVWYFQWAANIFWTSFAGGWGDDYFVAKVNISGNLLWVKNVWWTSFETPSSMQIDGNWNIYIAWYFNWSSNMFWTNLTSAWSNDIFIVKLDTIPKTNWFC